MHSKHTGVAPSFRSGRTDAHSHERRLQARTAPNATPAELTGCGHAIGAGVGHAVLFDRREGIPGMTATAILCPDCAADVLAQAIRESAGQADSGQAQAGDHGTAG